MVLMPFVCYTYGILLALQNEVVSQYTSATTGPATTPLLLGFACTKHS